MTVSTTTNNANFEGNGVATVFPFVFRFFTDADLVVTRVDNETGVELVLDLGIDYSVQGAGNAGGGSVTMLIGPLAVGYTLNVARVLSPVQLVSIINQGKFFPEVHERAFDYLTMLMQQSASGSDRAILTPITDPSGLSRLIPNASARALRVLAFSASGEPGVSNLTLEQLEQQSVAAGIFAQAAQQSAELASTSQIAAGESEQKAMAWAENPVDVPVEPGKFSAKHYAAKAAASVVWAAQPIGVPIAIWDHLVGVLPPPNNSPAYRYIKLTASDAYNAGVLASESVTGSVPLVQATAVITESGSPINGQTVRLINTERRVLRAGSSGVAEAAAMQGHRHGMNINTGDANIRLSSTNYLAGATPQPVVVGHSAANTVNTVMIADAISDGANGTPVVANEVRAKSVGATFYMRIR